MSYPKKVQDYTDTLVNILINDMDDPLFEDETFISVLKENLNEKSLEMFLKDGDTTILENDFEGILTQSMIKHSLIRLIDDGLINYIEDEDGEETFFLTKLGKEVGEKLVN